MRLAIAAAWSSCGKCLPGIRSIAASPAAARAFSPYVPAVTAAELVIEAFYPADSATSEALGLSIQS
jgi:hypothetical protein